MALGAWKQISVTDASRVIACVHNGVHYSASNATTSVVHRIDTATDLVMPDLTLSAALTNPRSFVPFGSKIYVGTWQGGIQSFDPITGVVTQEATAAASSASPLIAHVVHNNKIHWFGYLDGTHIEFDPANPAAPAVSATPGSRYVTGQVHGNRAIILNDVSAQALVVDF